MLWQALTLYFSTHTIIKGTALEIHLFHRAKPTRTSQSRLAWLRRQQSVQQHQQRSRRGFQALATHNSAMSCLAEQRRHSVCEQPHEPRAQHEERGQTSSRSAESERGWPADARRPWRRSCRCQHASQRGEERLGTACLSGGKRAPRVPGS